MAGAYKWKKLSELDINDCFFDSLKEDYPEFEEWYNKKAKEGKQAFTYIDDDAIGAFVMLKRGECEEIPLDNKTLPKCSRLKISTLKLSNRVEGVRLGEGAIGIALWNWLESNDEEIYVLVMPLAAANSSVSCLVFFSSEYGNILSCHSASIGSIAKALVSLLIKGKDVYGVEKMILFLLLMYTPSRLELYPASSKPNF